MHPLALSALQTQCGGGKATGAATTTGGGGAATTAQGSTPTTTSHAGANGMLVPAGGVLAAVMGIVAFL